MKTEVLDLIKKNPNLTPPELVKLTDDPNAAGIALRELIVAGIVNTDEDWELSVAKPDAEMEALQLKDSEDDSEDEP